MKRSLLRVELLEDRSVPTVDPIVTYIEPVMVTAPESYVIDPPLIDPYTDPAPAPAPEPAPAPLLPPDYIPPIAPPIWY